MKQDQQLQDLEHLTDEELSKMELEITAELQDIINNVELLESERNNISNPDSLGKVIEKEISDQIANQLGLNLSSESLIEDYEKNHQKSYKEVENKARMDKRFDKKKRETKAKFESGKLKDEYTGKVLDKKDEPNVDHVVSLREIEDNPWRKIGKTDTTDLASKEENFKVTNDSLNKSKGKKSIREYTDPKKMEQRHKDLDKQYQNQINKIKNENISEADKKIKIENATRRYQGKKDADVEKMREADRVARNSINKDIATDVAREVSKKAGKDALKTMLVQSMKSFLKDLISGLVRFLKSGQKSFERFMDEMKKSLVSFLSEARSIFQSGVSSFLGTITAELLSPFLKSFKKVYSMIRQSIGSLKEAILYLKNKENKDKPLSVKVAEIGKIVVASLTAAGALTLGGSLEALLMGIPGLNFPIPFLGTLASVLGLFISSAITGVMGAIVINRIDKMIAEKEKAKYTSEIIHTNNKALELQTVQINISGEQLGRTKDSSWNEIIDNHEQARDEIVEILTNITDSNSANKFNEKTNLKINNDLLNIQDELEGLV